MYIAVWGNGNTCVEAGVLSAHDSREAAEAAVSAWLAGQTNPVIGAWVRGE